MKKKRINLVKIAFRFIRALPWWGSATLALVVYVLLSHYTNNLNWYISPEWPFFFHQLNYYLWGVVHYSPPAISCAMLMISLTSFISSRKGRNLISRVKISKHSSPLLNMSWQEFEVLVGAFFERLGFTVNLTGGSADGGIDIILHRSNELHLVQCKQWRSNSVSVSVVRELYGLIAAHGADGGYVVTSGRFTKDAVEFAKGRDITLIDGAQLLQYIKGDDAPAQSIKCPQCGSNMVRRISRQGTNIGKSFWGCSGYPSCRCIIE
ncbi:TPA: restriction endonuclease [Aeromonas dhakensis]|uniref:restriction endonuclease n=1 Tax=Aeromonas dhakensis TaxID=196024 RepID=UPI00289099DF|nr:restriction endonuclease [Aeromonas dhakensis]